MLKNSFPKLALCLSGQPRSYFEAFKYVKKNLLDPYDVDVFVHSWKAENHLNHLKIYEEVNALYCPILCAFDKPLSKNVNNDLHVPNASHPANFCTSMFYSIYKCNNLRVTYESFSDVKYDFVIRSRFDLALNKKIDFQSLEKGKLYISKDTDGPNALFNDQFAISDPETMNVYASTFLFLRRHYHKNVLLCGHAMLQAQMDFFGIEVVRIDIDHPFENGKYNIGKHSLIREDMHKWVDPKIWGY